MAWRWPSQLEVEEGVRPYQAGGLVVSRLLRAGRPPFPSAAAAAVEMAAEASIYCCHHPCATTAMIEGRA